MIRDQQLYVKEKACGQCDMEEKILELEMLYEWLIVKESQNLNRDSIGDEYS